MGFIKRLFCRHKHLKCLTNLYGDAVFYYGGARSIHVCQDCGKEFYVDMIDADCKVKNFLPEEDYGDPEMDLEFTINMTKESSDIKIVKVTDINSGEIYAEFDENEGVIHLDRINDLIDEHHGNIHSRVIYHVKDENNNENEETQEESVRSTEYNRLQYDVDKNGIKKLKFLDPLYFV